MIDTMGFFVIVDNHTFNHLVNSSVLTQRIDRQTGLVEFEYNNSYVYFSWNYKVNFRLDTKTWQYDPFLGVPALVDGLPYIRFEFSAPKVLFGHNLESCSVSDALYAATVVREAFNKTFDVDISPVSDWYCFRLDSCANFILDNIEQVKSYIRYLQRFDYPRRIKNLYEDTGIYFASKYNTLKIYCKGVEFMKHDRHRFLSELEQKRLQKQANRILRVEVEHRDALKSIVDSLGRRRIMYSTFHRCMRIHDLLGVFDVKNEMNKVVKKFLSGTETKVTKSLDVYRLLHASLGYRQANTYYSVYTLLVTQGQKEARKYIPKSTYYKALAVFRRLGISVVASDIKKLDVSLPKGFPEDFSLDIDESNKYYQLPTPAPKHKVCVA